VLQKALEIAWQEVVCRARPEGCATAAPTDVAVQAVFCIDVRSEVYRRALEAQTGAVQTLGFAGFFGLPVEYRALAATHARPLLPGLLAPKLRATDAGLPRGAAGARVERLDVARVARVQEQRPDGWLRWWGRRAA